MIRTATPPAGWNTLAPHWPNALASRFIDDGHRCWHVQVSGEGPPLLLLHGTGAANFSFGDLLPLLAAHCTVIAPDLPGHGFSSTASPEELTLPGMARACTALLTALGSSPVMVAGHSAGAAIAIQMVLDGGVTPRQLVGLNPALLPPPPAYRELLAPLVHRLATTRLVSFSAAVIARQGGVIASLLRATRSSVTPANRLLYEQLLSAEPRVHDVLAMMANWSLTELVARLPRLTVPLRLIAGADDPWISLGDLTSLARRIPHCTIDTMPGGHLLHEEHPEAVAELLIGLLDSPAS